MYIYKLPEVQYRGMDAARPGCEAFYSLNLVLLNLVLNLVLEYSNLVVTVLIRTVMTQSLRIQSHIHHTKYSKHDKSQQLANFIGLRHYDKQNNAALAVLDRSTPNRR